MKRYIEIQIGLLIFIFLGILIIINLIFSRHRLRFDLTATKRYSLSTQTIKVLKNLKRPVKVIGFFATGAERDKAKELLEEYSYQSSKFKYTFIDPDRHPLEAKRYGITTYNTIVISCGEKEEKVSSTTEEAITNALIRVTRPGKKTIYFLSGHGEHPIDDIGKDGYSQIKEALSKQGYEVKDLSLFQTGKVPKDAATLIVAGPKKSLLSGEIKALSNYLNNKGRLILLLDPGSGSEFYPILKEMGVKLGKDMIIDKMSSLFGGDYLMPVVVRYNSSHPVTKDFKLACFFIMARSVWPSNKVEGNIGVETLAWTGRSSWAETDLSALRRGSVGFDKERDRPGPISVATVSTKGDSRLVVFGDSDFISNTYLGLSGNKDLFLNTINWLTEEKDLIAIPPKEIKGTPLILTKNQAKIIFWLPVVIIPGLIFVFGIVVYSRRKRL